MDKVFSPEELATIKTYLFSVIKDQKGRITLPNAYQALKDQFSSYQEKEFAPQLNKAIKEGKFSGLVVVKGRYGGIRMGKNTSSSTSDQETDLEENVEITEPELTPEIEDEPETTEPVQDVKIETKLEVPVIIPPPSKSPVINYKAVPPKKLDLWIKEKHYLVPHSCAEIKSLLSNVIEAKEEETGSIKFDGQTFGCSETSLDFLDKFLFYFHGATITYGEELN